MIPYAERRYKLSTPFDYFCDNAAQQLQTQEMSKTEILAELPRVGPADLAEVQAKLDELAGSEWLDDGDLTEDDKAALNAAIDDYGRAPQSGSSWDQVKSRIQSQLSK